MSGHDTNEQHAPAGVTVKLFVMVWFGLLALTGIEVILAYVQMSSLAIMLALLIGLSAIKTVMIVAYFMHMKYENFSLKMTLFPMCVFCILMMLVMMPDAVRALGLRSQ
jgi:cytochrome c oxidase subunit 4